MKPNATTNNKRLLPFSIWAALGGATLSASGAQAATYAWDCTDAYWDTTVTIGGSSRYCWSPNALPSSNDSVTVGPVGSANTTLRFEGASHSVNSLTVDSTSAFTIRFIQTSHSLTVYDEAIGKFGTGSFIQRNGTHTANYLTLGYYPLSDGNYTLNDGDLSVGTEYIGDGGTGVFLQDGGTHTVNDNLYLGRSLNGTDGDGAYTLNSGSLTVGTESIGDAGTGAFNQNGGTHTVSGDLILGDDAGDATYTLTGGTLNVGNIVNGSGNSSFHFKEGTLNLTGSSMDVDTFNLGYATGSNASFTLGGGQTVTAGTENIGHQGGAGVFIQDGGTHTVDNLSLGLFDGDGSYTLNGGTLDVGNIVNGTGNASFILNRGTLNLAGGSMDVDSFDIGYAFGSDGRFTLNQGENLTAGSESIGATGTGAFVQNGGTHIVTGELSLGQTLLGDGSYILSSGTLNVGAIVNGFGSSRFDLDGGTLNLTGGFFGGGPMDVDTFNIGNAQGSNGSFTLAGSSVTAGAETIGGSGSGVLTQTTGTHSVGDFYLGRESSGDGSYFLNGGNLSADFETIGINGSGRFTQSSGTHTVNSDLFLGYVGRGRYDLSGGSLTVNSETIGVFGSGRFTQDGGTHTVTNDLILGRFGGAGTYTLNNGTLNIGNIVNGSGSGTFNLDGGILSITGSSVDVDAFNVGNAAGSNGSFTLRRGRSLEADTETIGNAGSGRFIQAGGTHTVSDRLTIAAQPGSSGRYDLQGGSLTVSNGITNNEGGVFSLDAGTTVTVGGEGFANRGELNGAGTIVGDVNSNGILAPGDSPGMLAISGDYTQKALGIFNVEIGGLFAAIEYDVLNVSGVATLDGSLNVNLVDLGGGLFTPKAGDSFDILTADTLSGRFSSLTYASLLDPSLNWQIDYLADALGNTDVVRLSVVSAVPLPPAVALFGSGLLGLTGIARRKHTGRGP